MPGFVRPIRLARLVRFVHVARLVHHADRINVARLARLAAAASLCVTAACAAPPSKEMHQAQGALDAARAAGADRYAADEFAEAVAALDRSEQAAAQGDYRLALSHALDSRERAQDAARQAVERRAQARGNAERAVAVLDALVVRIEARLDDAEVVRLPRRILQPYGDVVSNGQEALQDARSALTRDDYSAAAAAAETAAARLQAALDAIDAAIAARRPRSRR